MNSFILLPPYSRRTGTRMPQTPSSFPRQESSPALNRRILPSVDCAFRAAPSGRYSDRRPRFPSESCPSRRFISTHPESYGHRMRTKALKALSSSPGRNLHRRSTAAFSLRSACASRCLSMNSFILPPPCGHRMRTGTLKALSSSPGRSLHRRSIAAAGRASLRNLAYPGVSFQLTRNHAATA